MSTGATGSLTKETARSGLDRVQAVSGLLMLMAASCGAYLLATDRSLWLLAVSHAVGLIIIVSLDVALGILSLAAKRGAYVPSVAAGALGLILQIGDVATAPQYSQSVSNFASYLFGLWAFDLLLALQAAVIVLGIYGRSYAGFLARRKSRKGREISYTRRSFLKYIVGFAGLIGVGVAVSSVKLPAPPPPAQTGTSSTSTSISAAVPPGAIANIATLQAGSPVYFQYPSGYPNVLFKNSDGSLTALSLLCTHVCCECEYLPSSDVIECPCHGSVFARDGSVIQGPAPVSLPQVTLRVDSASGYIFPVGVDSPGPCQV